MAAHHVAGDGQPEPDAPGNRIARAFEAEERLEHLLALVEGNAGAVVVDDHFDTPRALLGTDGNMGGVALGVIQQIGDTAEKGAGSERQLEFSFRLEVDRAALAPGLSHRLAEQRDDVARLGIFTSLAAREGQIALEHPLHLGDVFVQRGHAVVFRHHRQLQLHPGQRRAQVVGHTGQHLGALADLADDPRPHRDECGRRLTHLPGALGFEVGNVAALAERVRDAGEALDRPDLVAHEDRRHPQQDQRSSDRPQDEDVDGRTEQPVARSHHRQHPFRQLHLDDDETFQATRIDNGRFVYLVAQRAAQFALDVSGS